MQCAIATYTRAVLVITGHHVVCRCTNNDQPQQHSHHSAGCLVSMVLCFWTHTEPQNPSSHTLIVQLHTTWQPTMSYHVMQCPCRPHQRPGMRLPATLLLYYTLYLPHYALRIAAGHTVTVQSHAFRAAHNESQLCSFPNNRTAAPALCAATHCCPIVSECLTTRSRVYTATADHRRPCPTAAGEPLTHYTKPCFNGCIPRPTHNRQSRATPCDCCCSGRRILAQHDRPHPHGPCSRPDEMRPCPLPSSSPAAAGPVASSGATPSGCPC